MRFFLYDSCAGTEYAELGCWYAQQSFTGLSSLCDKFFCTKFSDGSFIRAFMLLNTGSALCVIAFFILPKVLVVQSDLKWGLPLIIGGENIATMFDAYIYKISLVAMSGTGKKLFSSEIGGIIAYHAIKWCCSACEDQKNTK